MIRQLAFALLLPLCSHAEPLTVTAYSHGVLTASGEPLEHGLTCAVSQDLYVKHRGKCAVFAGRLCYVNDSMGPGVRAGLDRYVENREQALAHGVQRGVEVEFRECAEVAEFVKTLKQQGAEQWLSIQRQRSSFILK